MDYVEINLNPKGKKTGDCETRAIAQATGASIEDVLNQEVKVYLETGYAIGMPQNEDALNQTARPTPPGKWTDLSPIGISLF